MRDVGLLHSTAPVLLVNQCAGRWVPAPLPVPTGATPASLTGIALTSLLSALAPALAVKPPAHPAVGYKRPAHARQQHVQDPEACCCRHVKIGKPSRPAHPYLLEGLAAPGTAGSGGSSRQDAWQCWHK